MNKPFTSKHCSPISYGTPLEKKSCANYGSPLDQKMKPGNVGYYDPEFEPHPSEKLPTRPENQAEIDAAKFSRDRASNLTKDMIKMPAGADRTNLAGQIYKIRKQSLDADARMRKQKRKDYKTILKAGETIGKSLKR
jgi:hypothetical protein